MWPRSSASPTATNASCCIEVALSFASCSPQRWERSDDAIVPTPPGLVCRQAVELMADYLDGRLPAATCRVSRRISPECPHCSEYLAQLRVTIDALGHAEPDDLSDDTVDDLGHLYRQWIAGG